MRQNKTIVYVDGFNLYYGCLKKSSYKWLDLKKLFDSVLSKHNHVYKIKYFTALLSSRDGNEGARTRQKYYLKALEKYTPELEIHYGHYLTHKVNAKVVNPPPNFINVYKTEEKGSDVNLALHLLNDAWKDEYECAVVVSNDSDLAEALRLVKEEHGKKTGLVFPNTNKKRKPSKKLTEHADFIKLIRANALRKSQLPSKIPGTNLYKPPKWLH